MGTTIRKEANMTQPPDMVSNYVRNVLFVVGFLVLTLILSIFSALYVPTSRFPVGAYVEIPAGATLSEAGDILENRGVIGSSFLFREYVRFFENGKFVSAGKYFFDTPLCLVSVAGRLVSGEYGIPRLKILIPEGSDVAEIAVILKTQISDFDSKKFLSLAFSEEGYLFPDTYFFFGNVTPEEVITAMKENFANKIKELQPKILASKKTLHDILTMASIIERETKTPESRRIVSGILWKRIKIGMPLQVDATFSYVNEKTTYELTAEDLHIDSLYNTYEYKGLPPGPICSPGLDSIIATLEPTVTPYLYYLSEKNGAMHYAKTFDDHKINKFKYLNR